jgi:two-component system, LytTR family, response regulator LytT
MKVLVFEDEAPAARRITKLIKEFDSDIEILAVIETVADGREWFANNDAPDLIFSDIQLSDALSFELYRELDLKVPVIFTTAYNEYAIEAFNHFSVDYLLKPIKIDDLAKSIAKYKEFGLKKDVETDFGAILDKIHGENYRTRFLVAYRDGMIPISASEIAYFYSENSATFLVKKDKKSYIISEPLDTIEKQLDPKIFYRANRKFILSAESVVKVEPYFNQKLIVKVNPPCEQEITISKIKATDFKNWLNS